MELILYHGQGILYTSLQFIFVLRMILNFVIYVKIDSPVTQSNISFWQTVSPKSWKEKKDMAARRPDIIDFDKEQGSIGRTEMFHIALTFWWPSQVWDDKSTRRLKLIANVLNILFLVLLLGTMMFYLYMQDINAKYHHVTRDWMKIFH
jgi:hypothetical protein